jgi:hypothetical protein
MMFNAARRERSAKHRLTLRRNFPGRCRMFAHSFRFRSASTALLAAALCIAIGFATTRTLPAQDSASSMAGGGMAHMAGHMHLTSLRPPQPGDQAKADAVVVAARQAMEPYKDYRKALANGYRIFLPNLPQPIYHFTNYENARAALTQFDPLKPTSLLYSKTAGGSYKLVGAMYTDRVGAAEDELNTRIPLSIARWHQHVNFCKAPPGQLAAYFGSDAKFGLMGSISTRDACEAAGGQFIPHVFGWMVHVYPYETDPAKVWSVEDDDQGHDNMDHSAMPGMKMN